MAQNTNRKAYSNKGKGKANYSKKYGPTPEEDAAVKAFFAESPKREKQKADEKSSNAESSNAESSNAESSNAESSYRPADHETPRAKMENPLPPGAKGLSASRFYVAPAPKLPPGEKGLANSCWVKEEAKDDAKDDAKA